MSSPLSPFYRRFDEGDEQQEPAVSEMVIAREAGGLIVCEERFPVGGEVRSGVSTDLVSIRFRVFWSCIEYGLCRLGSGDPFPNHFDNCPPAVAKNYCVVIS